MIKSELEIKNKDLIEQIMAIELIACRSLY